MMTGEPGSGRKANGMSQGLEEKIEKERLEQTMTVNEREREANRSRKERGDRKVGAELDEKVKEENTKSAARRVVQRSGV